MIDNLLNAFTHILIPTFNTSTAMPERHASSEKIIFLSLTAKLGSLIAFLGFGFGEVQLWWLRNDIINNSRKMTTTNDCQAKSQTVELPRLASTQRACVLNWWQVDLLIVCFDFKVTLQQSLGCIKDVALMQESTDSQSQGKATLSMEYFWAFAKPRGTKS